MPSNSTQLRAEQLAQRVMDYCDALAKFTQTDGIIDRRYLTPEHRRTNEQLSQWAQEYSLQTWQDEAGNQWIRLPAADANAKRLIIGSHTDTVPNGGRYDGMLGVITPLVLLQHLASQRTQLNFHIDVVGFGDEEGTRFGSTLLGSSAVAGVWDSNWADLTDDSGTTLADAFSHFGLDVNNISDAAITPNEVIAYIEAHIEQGPILEDTSRSLAPVRGIAGAKRYDISLIGHAGHAGTVPMNMRNDPLVVAAQWISEVYLQTCELNQQGNNVVATVGKIDVSPGAVNVIPGEAHLSLDVRSLDDALRDRLIDTLKACLDNLAESNHLNLVWKQTHHADAVACNEDLTSLLSKAIDSVQGSSSSLVSGAGHDAMVFAGKVPTAMMFVRCKKGISHHPSESIAVEDATKAIQALMSFILAIPCDSNVESSNDSYLQVSL